MMSVASADIIPMPSGSSLLPVFEFARAVIETPRAQVRPFHPKDGFVGPGTSPIKTTQTSLKVEAWPLFQAMAKSRWAGSFTADNVYAKAKAASLYYDDLFVWNPRNLRLSAGTTSHYKDSARTALSSNVGEAVAFLLMNDLGYAFWDHLPSLYERALYSRTIEHPERTKSAAFRGTTSPRKSGADKQARESDFVFETDNGIVVLVESKGHFVSPREEPSIKGELNYGLQQCKAWVDFIKPAPKKSYAVATYLRDQLDPLDEPSLIAMVDPKNKGGGSPDAVEIGRDWIRRGNYGAWLAGMGFARSSNALLYRVELPPTPISLPVFSYAGRKFVFTLLGWASPASLHPNVKLTSRLFQIYEQNPDYVFDLWYEPFVWHYNVLRPIVAGIELNVARKVEAALVNAASESLMEIDVVVGDPEQASEYFSGNVFLDGTLLGAINLEAKPKIEMMEFAF